MSSQIPMKNIVGYGCRVYDYVQKQKWDKRQVKSTQIIKRVIEKTYILECGHQVGMHLRPAKVRVGCYQCARWR